MTSVWEGSVKHSVRCWVPFDREARRALRAEGRLGGCGSNTRPGESEIPF
jgi:hypothetical protein